MSNAAYFRKEAERYRKLAASEMNPTLAEQLLGYAKEYEGWAAVLESADAAQPPSTTMQQQNIQQQQQKKENE
jgi:hypothetical protein